MIESYNQGMDVWITTKDIKEEDRLCMKPPTQARRHSVKGVFQVHLPVSGLKLSNNILVLQVKVNIREI